MMLAFAIGAALATPPIPPQAAVANDFDLSRRAERTLTRQIAAPLVPLPPRNLDTRDVAVDAPEAEWRVGESGPVLVVGAMGGRRSGMPKLAHVALDWSF